MGLKAGPHERGSGAHRDRHHGGETEPAGKDEQHGNEWDDLFLHVLHHAPGREEDRDHGDDEQVPPPERAYHGCDAAPERPGLVHHRECAADQEDEEDDLGRVGHAARERDDRVEEAHRARIDLMVGARHHDAPAGRLVVTAVERARRQHMARDGREDHAAGQQDEGVGDVELHRRR